jgi:hypothetical protein
MKLNDNISVDTLVAATTRSPILDVPTRSIKVEIFGQSQKRSF